jgi:hypothetical protein
LIAAPIAKLGAMSRAAAAGSPRVNLSTVNLPGVNFLHADCELACACPPR